MKRFLAVLGTALFVFLLTRYGWREVLAGVKTAGWGLLAVALYRFVSIGADTVAWRTLFAPSGRPALGRLLRIKWIGESVNTLLPVAQVGGDMVRAFLAARSGVGVAQAGSTVVVDFTLGLLAQLFYSALGVLFLLSRAGDHTTLRGWVIGLTVAALAIVVLIWVQRKGVFAPLARLGRRLADGRTGKTLTIGAEQLDREVASLYDAHSSLLVCTAWRMLGWLIRTGETWLALHFLGAGVSITDALILESLGTAVRSASFAVPASVGVQEGGFLLLGRLVGLTPETALALALVKRVRELLVSAPGLLAWYSTRKD